ncbi:nuclear receptor-binding protein-like [Ptychodera flava]|uniref:nuclear receptor-binding protein-like n=1 Tax=Ptychodera flava TaxID=63121 RepID=UPI003969F783
MSSEPEDKIAKDSGDESEDESEVLEESPCGRWQKRREEVTQRDVPGIDVAYLAMDTEEGVEVVWNEVQFSERRNFKAQEDKIKLVFDNLIQLEHVNIVKFHKYWTDVKSEKPRVIFITEYMSSGSLKQFLKRTKKNKKTINEKSWKRWCTQILSALSYLHSCQPPIIHGNLTCDTIFIQHNGLIKIGSVAPDTIHNHVKTFREEQKNMHYIAPEYGGMTGEVTTAVDIYAFGICALEMAVLGLQGNGDSSFIPSETIEASLNKIENRMQADFIRTCLTKDITKRPTARILLFHQILFEVHSLKLLAAHNFVNNERLLPDNLSDEAVDKKNEAEDKVIADIRHTDGREGVQWKYSQIPTLQLEKFLEDVKNGIYPLTAFALPAPQPVRPRPPTPEVPESVKSASPEPVDIEQRQILQIQCNIEDSQQTQLNRLTLFLRMDDKMNRHLTCDFTAEENGQKLAQELVHYGFINEKDVEKVANQINEHMQKTSSPHSSVVKS